MVLAGGSEPCVMEGCHSTIQLLNLAKAKSQRCHKKCLGTNLSVYQPIRWTMNLPVQQRRTNTSKFAVQNNIFKQLNFNQGMSSNYAIFFSAQFFTNWFIPIWNHLLKSHNLILAWSVLTWPKTEKCFPWKCDLLAVSQILRINSLVYDRLKLPGITPPQFQITKSVLKGCLDHFSEINYHV